MQVPNIKLLIVEPCSSETASSNKDTASRQASWKARPRHPRFRDLRLTYITDHWTTSFYPPTRPRHVAPDTPCTLHDPVGPKPWWVCSVFCFSKFPAGCCRSLSCNHSKNHKGQSSYNTSSERGNFGGEGLTHHRPRRVPPPSISNP